MVGARAAAVVRCWPNVVFPKACAYPSRSTG